MSTNVDNKVETAVAAREEKPSRVYRKPEYRVNKEDNQYAVQVFLPGITREEVNLDARRGVLKLETARAETTRTTDKALHRERYLGNYRLELQFGPEIDMGSISAQLQDGILKIRLAKQAELEGRVVPVE